jgi:hypothetical protein
MIHFLLHAAGHWSMPVIALLFIGAFCWAFPVVALANRGAVIIAVIAIGLYSGGLILGRKAQREADAADIAKARTELAKARSDEAAALADRAAIIAASERAAAVQAGQIEQLTRINAIRDARTAKVIAEIYNRPIPPGCPAAVSALREYLSQPVPTVVD